MSMIFNVQQALYTALNNDAALMARVSGVYDTVPEGSSYPYIVLSGAQTQDISNIAANRQQIELSIVAYYRGRSVQDLSDILQNVTDILDGATLTISGYQALPITITEQFSQKQVDGLTYKGAVTVRIVVRKI